MCTTASPLIQALPVQQQPQHLQCWRGAILLLLRQVHVIDKHHQLVASGWAKAAAPPCKSKTKAGNLKVAL